jgi:hypothetical protein
MKVAIYCFLSSPDRKKCKYQRISVKKNGHHVILLSSECICQILCVHFICVLLYSVCFVPPLSEMDLFSLFDKHPL